MLRTSLRLLSVLLLLAAPPAVAATDMYLRLSGIEGESPAQRHKDEIDVLAFSAGANFDPATASGPSLRDIAITKFVDKASVELFLATVNGTPIEEAVLSLERPFDGFVFFKVTLTNVLVTAVTPGGSGGDDRPIEFVSLRATGQVKWEYTPQLNNGSPGETIVGTYNVP